MTECGHWMPIAKTTCKLPAGHGGSHESKPRSRREQRAGIRAAQKRRWDEANKWSDEPCSRCGGVKTRFSSSGLCGDCSRQLTIKVAQAHRSV